MAKQQTDSPFNQDEFQRIFDEYRSKIEEITRSTGRNLESMRVPPLEAPVEEEPDLEADLGPTAEAEEPEPKPEPPAARPVPTPLAKRRVPLDLSLLDDDDASESEGEEPDGDEPPAKSARPQAAATRQNPVGPVIREYVESHLPESQKAIHEARKQAQRIIEEAQKQIRRDARKKTKAQVDKIMAKAKQDAEAYAEKARKTVEQERAVTMEAARAQVEDTLKAITEQARQQSQAKSQQIVQEAQERADRLMREVTEASAEISKQVKDVIDRARGTISEFEEKLQSETDTITKSIVDTQSRIEAMAVAAAEEAARNERAVNQPPAPTGKPMMVVRVLGERSNGRNGTQPLFFGMVEMIAPPETCDYRYFKSMKRYMVSIPGIKQLQESASEKELSALFDITEPLPLLEILSKVPQVNEVVSRSDRDIAIVFEN